MKYQIRTRTIKNGVERHSVILEVWSDGERAIVSGGTYADISEAHRAGMKLEMKYETDIQKTSALQGQLLLNDWAPEWLESRRGKVKGSTLIHYRWRLNHWVLPYLGKIQLNELTAVHIRRWLDQLHIGNHSKNLALATLKTCLNGAVNDGALVTSPAQGLKIETTRALKKQEKQRKPIKHWNHEEATTLLAASTGTRMEPMVVMGLLCGLRPGETQGLEWSDFDWLTGTVTISRTRSESPEGEYLSDSPKSGLNRTIKMPFEATKRMMAVMERQDESQGVFTLDPADARKRLKTLCAKIGIRVLFPHALRHTFASLALSAGAKITAVSEILGHANPQITLSIYSHAMPKDVLDVTSLVERAITPPEIIPLQEMVGQSGDPVVKQQEVNE